MARGHDITMGLILDIAKDLFARDGVKSTTMNNIAKKTRLGKSVLYQYFSSKDDLIAGVIDREIEHLKRSLKIDLDDEDDPIIKLARMWSNAIDFYKRDDFLMHLLRGNELGLSPYMYEGYIMKIETFVVGLLESIIQSAIDKNMFVECDSRIAAYMGYKIYQVGTYGKTETLKEYTPKQIMKKTIQIMGWGLLNRKPDQDIL